MNDRHDRPITDEDADATNGAATEMLPEAPETAEKPGCFLAFLLLKDPVWDRERFSERLRAEWGIEFDPDEEENADDDLDGDEDDEDDDSIFLEKIDGRIAAVSFMPVPVPEAEAEECARSNFLWPEAVDAAKAHGAQLLATLPGSDFENEDDLWESARLFVKLVATAADDPNVLGIYVNGTVLEPAFYRKWALDMKSGTDPIRDWVWVGLYRGEKGMCAYTSGLEKFGRREIEVLEADAEPGELFAFAGTLVLYVLDCRAELCDGQTIGFTEDDKHEIRLSEGAALPGMTLKLSYGEGFDEPES